MDIRKADLAGAWYPGGERECRGMIEAFLRDRTPGPRPAGTPYGGIVPHAGWVFSGSIACRVIHCLKTRTEPDVCILFGRHLHPGGRNYLMKDGGWATPLGELMIDEEVAARVALDFPFVLETAAHYKVDNTIELQLPFLKYFFPEIRIVPVGVPPRIPSVEIGARVVEICAELGRRTVVLGSTDLTHYGHNYGYTPQGTGSGALKWVKEVNDREIVELMLAMDAEGVVRKALENQNACCSGAAAAAIAASRALGADRAETIHYATSYDVRPDSSFVGYVGVVFLG